MNDRDRQNFLQLLLAADALLRWAVTHRDADFEGAGETHHMIPEWKELRESVATLTPALYDVKDSL